MGAALVLVLVGLGALAAGVLIGRYYVPDDRQLRRTARHSRAYMRALAHLIARDHETVIEELRGVVEENIEDVEPYFALAALFRTRGEHERAIRVHQALAMRERDKRKLRQRAMYELGLDFRAAGMPRRATKAMEEVLIEDPGHQGALRVLAALYEEQGRFSESAGLWQRLGKRRGEDVSARQHHLLVAGAQSALARDDGESAKHMLRSAQKLRESAHFYAAAAELASSRGNYRGARERLKQALIADPALGPHLIPGIIAAEQGLAEDEKAGRKGRARDELEEETPDSRLQTSDPAASGVKLLEVEGASGELALSPSLKPEARNPKPASPASVEQRVRALLEEVEAQTGPRLELALMRAQLTQGATTDMAHELIERFPEALAARVATARLALASSDASKARTALEQLAGDQGTLAWALRGRWQCGHCGHRPTAFSWRCGQCRRWSSLRMETGIEPPPIAPRDRRAEPRSRPEGLLGATPDVALPEPTLEHGLTDEELARASTRRSVLGRVGGWLSNVWRRGA
jgi:lipopolysaccharide biosynthesis regulator YciM